MDKLEIPMKLPSLNQYINECRKTNMQGANEKRKLENDLAKFINKLPKYDNPIRIHFLWIEGNRRRDLDNICFARKFILDAMVKCGKLKDDNRKCVTGFTDEFIYSNETKVVLNIEEIEGME